MELRKFTFTTPSGYEVTIREQNGEDEDILTNPRDAANLMNLSKFMAAIIVNSNITPSGKVTLKDVLALPLLDRYCILFQSRIFSLGETLEISYQWPGSKEPTLYEENLNNYLFDYSTQPTQEELDSKPYAIPYYLEPDNLVNKVITLESGKVISFDCLTGNSEQFILNLEESKKTRNSELLARNLKLEVDGVMEKVHNFSLFSVRDMAEIRKAVATYDPIFTGVTELENPETGEKTLYPILASSNFFFLTEA
jgi:hypothetical protein